MDRAVQKLLEIIFAFHFRTFRYFLPKINRSGSSSYNVARLWSIIIWSCVNSIASIMFQYILSVWWEKNFRWSRMWLISIREKKNETREVSPHNRVRSEEWGVVILLSTSHEMWHNLWSTWALFLRFSCSSEGKSSLYPFINAWPSSTHWFTESIRSYISFILFWVFIN